MNVPYLVPKDEETPYPADFERVVSAVRSMGYALDVIESGRAAGAIFDDIPVLVSDSGGVGHGHGTRERRVGAVCDGGQLEP